MSDLATASRNGDQVLTRFPDGLRERLKQRASENGRSMNSEIVAAVERHLAASRLEELEARIARLEASLWR